MGNVPGTKRGKKGGFKGQGHALDADNISNTEVDARERQRIAAEKRGNEWQNRLEKKRQVRNANTEVGAESKGTAAAARDKMFKDMTNSECAEQLNSDRNNLERSGFNPYEAVNSSSHRAVFISDESPNQILVELLESAMHKCQLNSISDLIQRADAVENADASLSNTLKRAVDIQLQLAILDSAGQLTQDILESLSTSFEELYAAKMRDTESGTKNVNVLMKILDNIHNNPTEDKYRKLRVENETIKARLVQFANGTPLKILCHAGFQKQTENSGELVYVLPMDDALFEPKYFILKQKLVEILV